MFITHGLTVQPEPYTTSTQRADHTHAPAFDWGVSYNNILSKTCVIILPLYSSPGAFRFVLHSGWLHADYRTQTTGTGDGTVHSTTTAGRQAGSDCNSIKTS